MREFMKDIDSFKEEMTSILYPKQIREYVNGLSKRRLKWFYKQMKEPMEFLEDEEYLYYKFKWIEQRGFKDLSFEIYLEAWFNPENFPNIIKPEWEKKLDKRYDRKMSKIIKSMYKNSHSKQ